MASLKALTTIALERGKVAPGQVFQLHSKEAAKQLVAEGLAEESQEEVKTEALDATPDTKKLSISTSKPAADKKPADNPA